MKTTELGDLGKGKILADLLSRGVKVAIPISEDLRYDLVIDRDGKLERMQCKATVSDGQVLAVKCRSTSSWAGKTRNTHKYTASDVDWIAVYDQTTESVYYVPSSELGKGRTELRLRLVPGRQTKNVRWAQDYTSLK